ncbi:MAG: hypothetical protein M3P37_07615 [Actinomycetota bacterium]|nr:hypothetical protein [Actinomycetota bacterium]
MASALASFRGGGEQVGGGQVHGDEDLAGLHGGRDEHPGRHLAPARLHHHPVIGLEAERSGVVGRHLHVGVGGGQGPEGGRLVGTGPGVPLGGGPRPMSRMKG